LPAERAPGNSLAASPKRIPASLPPATFEDSPDAARHLVRVPGVALVVDGYNVTLSSWPGADLPMQRRRLVDSLAELAIRAGTEVLVVFDGVDDGNRLQLPASVRGRMRVRFTASEVEADEVIIALVDSMPVHRPVVVATNDRRVRDDAARKGANVITVDQLLAAIGRGSSPTG
jgi:predicted RNA-binding protein with PIN domain